MWAPLVGAGIAAGAAFFLRHRPIGLGASIAATAVFCGFAAGVLREWWVSAPVLSRVTVGSLSGFVQSVEERQKGGRLVLRLTDLATVPAHERPRRVRVTVRDLHGLKPGDFLAARARLLPLPEAARPGGYDSRGTPVSTGSGRWAL